MVVKSFLKLGTSNKMVGKIGCKRQAVKVL